MVESTDPAATEQEATSAATHAALVELKAVDDNYPLFGAVATDPTMLLAGLFKQDGEAFGAAADPALLTRLGLKSGDRITIGNGKPGPVTRQLRERFQQLVRQ